MGSVLQEMLDRVDRYIAKHQLIISDTLGNGNDGNVWLTTKQTAIKGFLRVETYERERDCYRRLFDTNTKRAAGFVVPELFNYDNTLLVIEMGVVMPPCVLDFGKAYVDRPPDFSPEVLAETEAAERELFEPDQWKQVQRVRGALKLIGIHYFDARPTNIMFPK